MKVKYSKKELAFIRAADKLLAAFGPIVDYRTKKQYKLVPFVREKPT